jgi:hypothetical protein
VCAVDFVGALKWHYYPIHTLQDYSLWLIYFDEIITLSQVYIDLLFFVSNRLWAKFIRDYFNFIFFLQNDVT